MAAFDLREAIEKSKSHEFPKNYKSSAAVPGTPQDDRTSISSTTRRKVLDRDGYQCCNCHKEGGKFGNHDLEVHHIVPRSLGGTDSKTNLATLCTECHKAAHGWKNDPNWG